MKLWRSWSVERSPCPQYPPKCIACFFFSFFPAHPQAPAAYKSHSEQFSSIVPQLHCSVYYEYAATQDNAGAASQSPQRDTSSVNQYAWLLWDKSWDLAKPGATLPGTLMTCAHDFHMCGRSPKTLDQLLHHTVTKPGLAQIHFLSGSSHSLICNYWVHFLSTNCLKFAAHTPNERECFFYYYTLFQLVSVLFSDFLTESEVNYCLCGLKQHRILQKYDYTQKYTHTGMGTEAERDREERNTRKSCKSEL